MASDWTDLKDFVGVTRDTEEDLITSCHSQAVALVTKVNKMWDSTTNTWVASAAPEVIVDRAVLAVGAELYNQSKTKNGVMQLAAFDEAPIRVARDPLTPAYPLLAPWVVFGL